jgi:hypothetical protein
MKEFSEAIQIPMSHLDFVLWYKETGEILKYPRLEPLISSLSDQMIGTGFQFRHQKVRPLFTLRQEA